MTFLFWSGKQRMSHARVAVVTGVFRPTSYTYIRAGQHLSMGAMTLQGRCLCLLPGRVCYCILCALMFQSRSAHLTRGSYTNSLGRTMNCEGESVTSACDTRGGLQASALGLVIFTLMLLLEFSISGVFNTCQQIPEDNCFSHQCAKIVIKYSQLFVSVLLFI